ncbi:hypothetical protein HY571_02590 [Candidatus Micrarchaeota archaeon]|nr:hypothetical protein [Candidatus Micrarchaeota archaeon]
MALRETLKLYSFANKQRDEFYNTKWRVFIALVILLGMWVTFDYLQTTYPQTADNVVVSAQSGTEVQAFQRMFNWFVTGFLAGFVAFALMQEGEFLLATKNLAKQLSARFREPKKRSARKRI